jgi:hypothetical protein
MKRLACAIVMSLTALPALAGCGGNAAHGGVTGVLEQVGGPSPGSPVGLPGQVVAVNSAGAQFTTAVGADGRFTLSLPPGTYQFSGYSPLMGDGKMRCSAAQAVHVVTGRTRSHVTVVCSIT